MRYNEQYKAISSELEKILRLGYSSYTIFDDWLDLMLFALMRNDEQYLEVVHKYKNTGDMGKREIDYFAHAFGLLLKFMKESNEELLGEIYQQWNMANKYRGQYFTPPHIASFMAQITSATGGRILDPACGAGIMLVEAIKNMTGEQIARSVFYGQDIDITCVKMCALNLLFFNVNGYVIWGDTLLMEVKRVYETRRTYAGGYIRILNEEETAAFTESYRGALHKSNKMYEPTKQNGEASVTELTKNQLQLF